MKQAFGVDPHPWQVELLRALTTHKRIGVRSGNGAGKSTALAWAIIWFLVTRRPAKVLVTAAKETQLEDVLWAEIRLWLSKEPRRLFPFFTMQANKIIFKEEPNNFAIARVARKEHPEAFQGHHSENMLLIADEASGVDDAIFEAGLGVMSTPGAITVLCGNPTRTSGFFFDVFHKMRQRWHRLHWNCEVINQTHPGQVQSDIIDEVISRYGKDSNPYRYRILGEFPTSEEDAVIPLHLIEAATRRKVVRAEGFMPVWGLDVARFGDDRTALVKRVHNVMIEPPKFWRQKDTMQVAGLMLHEFNETQDRPEELFTDVIGIGAGVVDRMREMSLPVRGINVAESPAVKERYSRLRDELWWTAREWFERLDCSIPEPSGLMDDPMETLISELSQPKYTHIGGKIKVESKDDLKKRGLPSPDLADAFILTLAGGKAKSPMALDRYQRRALERMYAGSGSWMAG